ncbi:MAG: hypothetical protein GX765_00465 [Candidatus Moranbacteria bacterium]|nr:hypothetical protein [Candidatus Moranbacteria bacterium]
MKNLIGWGVIILLVVGVIRWPFITLVLLFFSLVLLYAVCHGLLLWATVAYFGRVVRKFPGQGSSATTAYGYGVVTGNSSIIFISKRQCGQRRINPYCNIGKIASNFILLAHGLPTERLRITQLIKMESVKNYDFRGNFVSEKRNHLFFCVVVS